MKYTTTVHFPEDLVELRGFKRIQMYAMMLIRNWRITLRRLLLLLIPISILYTGIAFLLVLMPMVRMLSLQSSPYILILLEQVVWMCTLSVILWVHLKRRHWQNGIVVTLLVLLVIKGIALTALHLQTLWCSRPNFNNEYIFSIPITVPCSNDICMLNVEEKDRPKLCAIMYDFFHALNVRQQNPRAVARALFAQHVIQILLALAIIVHALEDETRLVF